MSPVERNVAVIPLVDLERHLRAHGCVLLRQGSRHTIWQNPSAQRRTSVPRHRQLPRTTARLICSQLAIPVIG